MGKEESWMERRKLFLPRTLQEVLKEDKPLKQDCSRP